MGAIPEMMVSVGETPWHRQGLVLPEDTVLTPADAYTMGGLDYKIVKSTMIDGQSYEPIEGRWLLKREVANALHDKMIGNKPQIVSDRYEIIQNYEMVDLVNELSLPVTTAGTMFNSSMAWMLLDLGESIAFKGTEEATQRYLLVATHHGTGNFVVYVVTVRVVCQNTYDFATQTGDLRWSIRHSSSAKDRLIEAKVGLERAYRAMDDMDQQIMELLHKDFRDSQFEELVNTIQPKVEAKMGPHKVTGDWVQLNTKAFNAASTTRTAMWSLWENDNGTIPRKSAFHAIQAVNEYEQHQHGHGKNRDQRMMQKFIKGDMPMTRTAEKLVRELAGVR